jgi:nucleoside-diphosphate kinase
MSCAMTTLILLKPDCISKGLCGEVISRFEKAGYEIRGAKMLRLTPALLREHYAHIADKPFFPEVGAFMSQGPVIALALSGEDVIAGVRELLGPTDSRKAAKGTIRGDFGVDMMINVVHASDSPENAVLELRRFFAENELFGASSAG